MGFTLNKKDALVCVVSPRNSSTTNLAVGNSYTFTGVWERTNHSDIMVNLYADQICSILIQFSMDGVVVHSTITKTSVAGTNEFTTAVKGSRYVRIVVTTDSLTTGVFNLQTQYGIFRAGNSPINSILASDADGLTVRSIDSKLDLAFGRFQGMSEDAKFGSCFDMDSADVPFDIWYPSGDNVSNLSKSKTFPGSALPIYVASTSAADNGVVALSYLNSSGVAVCANVTLNGTTAVSVAPALDCNRVRSVSGVVNGAISVACTAVFSGGVPGDITKLLAYVPIGYGQTQQTHDTVPSDKRRRIKWVVLYCSRAAGATGSATVVLETRPSGGNWLVKRVYPVTTSTNVSKPVAGIILEPLTQIRMRCVSASDGDTVITGEYHFEDLNT